MEIFREELFDKFLEDHLKKILKEFLRQSILNKVLQRSRGSLPE